MLGPKIWTSRQANLDMRGVWCCDVVYGDRDHQAGKGTWLLLPPIGFEDRSGLRHEPELQQLHACWLHNLMEIRAQQARRLVIMKQCYFIHQNSNNGGTVNKREVNRSRLDCDLQVL
jgi:hypothetical protein